jgi:thioredoxin 1
MFQKIKMKNILFIILAGIAGFILYKYKNPTVNFKEDTKGGIQFHKGTWAEALALAKKNNKLIFLDIYASWCGPCKKLKKRTFSSDKVGTYFNEHFINVSLDGEEGEGVTVSSKYNVSSYPSLFFIDGDGKIISKAEGFLNANEIIQFGKTVVK